MGSSRNAPGDDIRRCGDHFHVKLPKTKMSWNWNDKFHFPDKGLPTVLSSRGIDLDNDRGKIWPDRGSLVYVNGLHKNDYTPFRVTKMLLGDYIVLRRSGSPMGDDHCADWKDGELPDKNSNWHWTHWIYSEGDWKLYRLSDISDQPSKSDLAANKGLREDFARRQNERSAGNKGD